jgi:hypothetical protein
MKKLMLFVFLVFAAFAVHAQGGNNNQEQRARQKAEAAARQCADVQGLQLFSSATASTICDYTHPSPNFFGYTVVVWAQPNCPPPNICPAGPVTLLATVEVSCSGQVTHVVCYNAPQ